jgi:hypothetical protein
MPTESSASPPDVSTQTAWPARGAAHNRAVRRQPAIVAPVLALPAAAILYALMGR